MLSKEEWEYYKTFIKDANKDIKEGRTYTKEKFWKLPKEEKRIGEKDYQK